MEARRPSAAQFYPADCGRAAEAFLRGFVPPPEPARIVAGIVPHAGWQYSGSVAAKVFASIRAHGQPATFVILGAVHRWIGINGVYARVALITPLGPVPIDEDLAACILAETPDWTVGDPDCHSGEHSIEVELPFVKYLFPRARVVPIAVNPDSRAVPLGRQIGRILRDRSVDAVVIGSSDLTHYGKPYGFTPAGFGPQARFWMQENDSKMLRLVEDMSDSEITEEAYRHRNACGAGAIAATVAAARVLGAGCGLVIEHITSYDVIPEGEFRMAVGYAGILFARPQDGRNEREEIFEKES
jgi:AmmeMemoRadiSam system protein B